MTGPTEAPRDVDLAAAVNLGALNAVGSLRVGKRSYMSTWMLRASKRWARRAQEIEDAHPQEWVSPHVEEHIDFVVSSILNAAMFVEGMVNELFADAADEYGLTGEG